MQATTHFSQPEAAVSSGLLSTSSNVSGSLGHLPGDHTHLDAEIEATARELMFGIIDARDVPADQQRAVAEQIVVSFPRFAAEQYVLRGEPVASVAFDLDQQIEQLTNGSRLSAFASREFRVIDSSDDADPAKVDAIEEALEELSRVGFPPRGMKFEAGLPSGGLLIAKEMGATILVPSSRRALEAIYS
jgi:hypothetical protein